MTPEHALAIIEQERLDVLAEGHTEADCNMIAAYVLASAYRRLLAQATRPEALLPDAKDAARYRWLNKKYDVLLKVGENDDDYTKRHVALKCGPELDRWIDARLAEETPSPLGSIKE